MDKTFDMQPLVRSSNFELLRIVAMSMVVIHHFIVHILAPAMPEGGGILSFANTFVICGVNLFVMISGYFQIKLSWSSLLKLWLFVGFYVVIALIGYEYYALEHHTTELSWKCLALPFALFSKSGYWFVSCYFVLMIFSPIFNIALSNMSLKTLRKCILILTFFTCYSGFVMANSANPTGYTAVHFFYLYVLGNYVRKEPMLKNYDKRVCLLLFVCTVLGYGVISGLIANFPALHPYYPRLFAYNNPIIIFASISMFCFFRHLDLKNKFINQIAASMLGVYILQESDLGQIFYENVSFQISKNGFSMHYFILLALTFIGLFVGVVFIDQIRKALCNPLARWIDAVIPQKFQLNFNENH